MIKNHTDFIPEEEVWSQEYYGEVLNEIYRPHSLNDLWLYYEEGSLLYIPFCHDEWRQP